MKNNFKTYQYLNKNKNHIDRAWNLNNEYGLGQSYSGQGVVVGVIDGHGFQYTHPDLQGQLHAGYNSINNTTFTNDIIVTTNLAHGNNVCGVIVAKLGNNEGVAGVAYNAKVFPCLTSLSSAQISACFEKCMNYDGNGNSVDIINMSWGSNNTFTQAQAENLPYYENLLICYEDGRDGKGIVLINSAGNKDEERSQAPAVLSEVLSVGATNPNDQRKLNGDGFGDWLQGGGSYWSGLDVSAPGVCLPSTDFTGSNGYSSGDYFSFGGTSGAAPLVSGIAALLLEKEPSLTQTEVYQALRDGCDKVGGYTYGANGKTLEMGFGRVNAYNTVYQIIASTNEIKADIDFSITNPINNNLVIKLKNINNYTITIYDNLGKLVLETSLTYDESNINLSTFANGLYFLKVSDNKSFKTTSKKFIKR